MSVTETIDLGRLRRELDARLATETAERYAVIGLVLAMLLYVAVALYLSRGATFLADEIAWYGDPSAGLDPGFVLKPHNGHLEAVTRGFFGASLELFGSSQVPLRILMVLSVCAAVGTLFLLLRDRVGGPLALVASVLMLFLGFSPVLLATTMTVFAISTALGFGALRALELGRPRGDALACALLLLCVLTFSLGLPFLAGAAVLILRDRRDWRRRAWIVGIPALAYAAWYVWALKFDEGSAVASNVLLVPGYAADSLAAAAGALSGLAHDFEGASSQGPIDIGWGRIVAAGLVFVFVRGWRRDGHSDFAVAVLAVLVVLWIAGGLSVGGFRQPTESRYVFSVGALVILLGAELFRGNGSGAATGLFAAAVLLIALPANLAALRGDGADIRDNSARVRAQLAAAELERANANGAGLDGSLGPFDPASIGALLDAEDRWGSFATPLDELAGATPLARDAADATLGRILELQLEPVRAAPRRCAPASAVGLQVPAGETIVLRSVLGGGVRLRRFGDGSTIVAGTLEPGELAALSFPDDSSPVPWTLAAPGVSDLQACAG